MKGLNVKLDTMKLLGETIGKNTLWHALQQYLFRLLLIQHVTYIPEDWELSVDTRTHRLELCTGVRFIAMLVSPVMRLYILPRRRASPNAPSSPQKHHTAVPLLPQLQDPPWQLQALSSSEPALAWTPMTSEFAPSHPSHINPFCSESDSLSLSLAALEAHKSYRCFQINLRAWHPYPSPVPSSFLFIQGVLDKLVHGQNGLFKNRDITLSTKVHLVRAMVFPVVMYGCESWTINKVQHQRIDAFELWCWGTLESPLDCTEIQPVHSKGISPGYSLEGLKD